MTSDGFIRVFPRRTSMTPTDPLAFVGDPPLFGRPEDPETPVAVVSVQAGPPQERCGDSPKGRNQNRGGVMPELIRDEFDAMNVLNSWVRSRDHKGEHVVFAIYDWKLEIIKRAIRNNETDIFPVFAKTRCRDCGGTGRYIDSFGGTWPHCRKCNSTGTVKLFFLETEIKGYRWHTPRERTYLLKLPTGFYECSEEAVDWEPNQEGICLELSEIVGCLNILEETLGRNVLGSHSIEDRDKYYDTVHHEDYRIFLGSSARICEFCGDAFEQGCYHHVTRKYVQWTAWACNSCRAVYATHSKWSEEQNRYIPDCGNGRSIFDEFRPPIALIKNAEVQKWLARRI